jgi:hypothetical protein
MNSLTLLDRIAPGEPISAEWANALLAEIERLRRWSVGAPLRMVAGEAGIALSATRESEPQLIELLGALAAGGSAAAKRLHWSEAANDFLDLDAANITVFDALGTFVGGAGDRGYAFFNRGSGRWEILQLAC